MSLLILVVLFVGGGDCRPAGLLKDVRSAFESHAHAQQKKIRERPGVMKAWILLTVDFEGAGG